MADPDPARARRGLREAGFVLLCFAAASAVPFLPPDAKARFAALFLGAPPLLTIALATVSGTGALWLLGSRGFFAAPDPPDGAPSRKPGLGLGPAFYWGAMIAAAAIALDLVVPAGADAAPGWPAAWLLEPALAVVRLALLHLVPLALLVALIRRPRPAMLLAAAMVPGAALAAGAMRGEPLALAPQMLAWATGLAEFALLRRHGLGAMVAFRAAHTLVWQILWGGARHALLPGGP